MTKIFNKEVDTWGGLYTSDSKQRYAIFQGNARKRVALRMNHAVEMLALPPGSRLLDVACGSGSFGMHLRDSGIDWTGADIAFNMVAAGRQGADLDPAQAHWLNASAARLPFADGHFDAVVCLGMINFYPPKAMPALLGEMARVVKPGGALLITSLRLDVLTWIRSRLYPRVPLPFSSPGPLYPVHYRRMEGLAQQAGLNCVAIRKVGKYFNLPHYSMMKLQRADGT